MPTMRDSMIFRDLGGGIEAARRRKMTLWRPWSSLPTWRLAVAGGSTTSRPRTWRGLEWLAGQSRLPVVVKGVVRGDDARRCLSSGAAGVIVSNHGGRQLDY